MDCGFGVATAHRLPHCPSCRGWLWEWGETSPFGLGPPAGTLEEDLPASLGAILLALALLAFLWLGLAGVAYGLFRLIQGAKISVRSTKAGRLSHGPNVHLSGRKGRATFTLRLRQTAFGKRLIVVTVAKTPRAKATKKSSVSLPRSKSTAARR